MAVITQVIYGKCGRCRCRETEVFNLANWVNESAIPINTERIQKEKQFGNGGL